MLNKIARIIMMIGSCGVITVSIPLIAIYSNASIAPRSISSAVGITLFAGVILFPITHSFIAAITMNSMGKKSDGWLKRLIMTLIGIFLVGAALLAPIVCLVLFEEYMKYKHGEVMPTNGVVMPWDAKLHQYADLSVGIIIGGLIIGAICGIYFEKYLRNKTEREKWFWSGLGIAIITMLVLVPILIVISLWLGININIAWVKHLFGLSARSFMLLLILIEHLFVFSLSCLISSLIFGFKTQRKGRLYGAIFGGIFSVFMPTVPLILGMDGFIYRFAVGGVWYVWVMIILCSLSMVTCGALGGSLGERLAQRRIPKVA